LTAIRVDGLFAVGKTDRVCIGNGNLCKEKIVNPVNCWTDSVALEDGNEGISHTPKDPSRASSSKRYISVNVDCTFPEDHSLETVIWVLEQAREKSQGGLQRESR
jgi:hypothetical protein